VKPTVVVTVLAAVLAIAAGVAIAGLPSTPPGADVRVLAVPTIDTRPTVTLAPIDVEPISTTTVPPTSTSAAPASTSTTTTDAVVQRSTTTTTPTSTTTTTSIPDTVDALRARDELNVATANASASGGVATSHAEILRARGYTTVNPVDSEPSPNSAVYYEPGFELEASRLATDLGWDPIGLAPMSELPTLLTDQTFELVALVGLDRA
jgi:hypothetical protein